MEMIGTAFGHCGDSRFLACRDYWLGARTARVCVVRRSPVEQLAFSSSGSWIFFTEQEPRGTGRCGDGWSVWQLLVTGV